MHLETNFVRCLTLRHLSFGVILGSHILIPKLIARPARCMIAALFEGQDPDEILEIRLGCEHRSHVYEHLFAFTVHGTCSDLNTLAAAALLLGGWRSSHRGAFTHRVQI